MDTVPPSSLLVNDLLATYAVFNCCC